MGSNERVEAFVVAIGLTPTAKLREGRLADIAPTVLALMGLPKPAEMRGEGLIANRTGLLVWKQGGASARAIDLRGAS